MSLYLRGLQTERSSTPGEPLLGVRFWPSGWCWRRRPGGVEGLVPNSWPEGGLGCS